MVGPMLGAFLMSITTLQYALFVNIIGASLAVLTLPSSVNFLLPYAYFIKYFIFSFANSSRVLGVLPVSL